MIELLRRICNEQVVKDSVRVLLGLPRRDQHRDRAAEPGVFWTFEEAKISRQKETLSNSLLGVKCLWGPSCLCIFELVA